MTVTVGPACTACGACLITCPEAALVPAPRRPVLDPRRCTGCLACVEVCPAGAITPAGGTTPSNVEGGAPTTLVGTAERSWAPA